MTRFAPMKKVTKVYDHLLPNNKRKANIYAGQKNENALCKIVYSSKKGSNYSVKSVHLGKIVSLFGWINLSLFSN